jgi:hypothetical protein
MDAFESPFWDLTTAVAWALTREPAAVRVAADPENEAALFDVREGHLARWAEVNERLWAESGWSKPDDPHGWRVDILDDHIDPADLPPPLDELRVWRMRQLEAAGKIRLISREAAFPIEDYLASLFVAGRINVIVYPPGDVAARAVPPSDWAFFEIVGGDHQRFFVRRIGERISAFSDVRVERAQALAVFPPLEGAPVLPVLPLLEEAPAPTRAQPLGRRPTEQAAQAKRTRERRTTQRKPTMHAAAAEALQRLFPSERPLHKRKELLRLLNKEPGLETLSLSSLDRAKAMVWPAGSSKRLT